MKLYQSGQWQQAQNKATGLKPGSDAERAWLAQFLRPRTAPGWGAVVAWFSLIHLAASELADAFDALARTLVPGGTLLVALHAGQGVAHLDTWLGNDVDLDVVLQAGQAGPLGFGDRKEFGNHAY